MNGVRLALSLGWLAFGFRSALAAWGLFIILALAPSFDAMAGHDYVLQPGDVVTVSVWREPDLDRTLLVRPDGGISFPLAGDITAAGKTVDQLSGELVSKLTKFIPSPVVTVTLQENLGNRIYVAGKVERPGVFQVNQDVSVLQAISMAGGPTPFADLKGIKVLRRESGVERAIPFNYKQVQRGERLEQNIILRPGDTVLVP